MSEPNEELLEVVLGLLEKSKQQDESIQKAIETLEREKTALETLKNSIGATTLAGVALGVKNALETQNKALETHFDRLGSITAKLQQAKKVLDWQNSLFYFGTLTVFMVCVSAIALFLIPSLDEIRERKAELSALNAHIETTSNLKRLQVSTCNKQTCIKIIESQCNYGKKGDRYCVADLK